jgi:hypothetical protein
MKNILKNSILYYIAVPVLVAIWPALVAAIYLPNARAKLDTDMSDYTRANDIMLEILSLAPERTELGDPNEDQAQFQYYQVVPNVASLCSIPSNKCKLNTGTPIEAKTGKTQSASVRLTNIDITSFAKFLSMIQAHWPKLVCNSVTLNKKAGSPDEWEILTDFKYFYSASD